MITFPLQPAQKLRLLEPPLLPAFPSPPDLPGFSLTRSSPGKESISSLPLLWLLSSLANSPKYSISYPPPFSKGLYADRGENRTLVDLQAIKLVDGGLQTEAECPKGGSIVMLNSILESLGLLVTSLAYSFCYSNLVP